MAKLPGLAWVGFLLIPIACEAVVLIFIFRFPRRWSVQALLIANFVTWIVTLLLLRGLWMFADKFVALVYFTIGTPLKAIIVSLLIYVQRDQSGTVGNIKRGLSRCVAWALLSIILGWLLTLEYLNILDMLGPI